MERIAEEEQKQRPIFQTQEGSCLASIWDNERTIKGNSVVFREATFSKRYRDKDGQFKSTTKYTDAKELLDAVIAIATTTRELLSRGEE